MNYLITGGAGFIGSAVAKKLIESGQRVIVVDDFSYGKMDNIAAIKDSPQFTLQQRSICDDLIDIFEKDRIDVIIHLAALLRVQFTIHHPEKAHDVNINGTFNILEAARTHKVSRVVLASSAAVYGNQEMLPFREDLLPAPVSPYGVHKLTAEAYAKVYQLLYGVPTISLRYFNVYGPGQSPEGDYGFLLPKFILMVKDDQQPTIFGDGNQTRDFVYISDVVEATLKAAHTQDSRCIGNVFNIGSSDRTSVNDIAREIITLSGKSITPLYGPAVNEPRHTLADISRAKELLGWEPTISFREGIQHTYHYFAG